MGLTGTAGPARHAVAVAGLVLAAALLFAACGGDDSGLTRAEVQEIVRAELAAGSPASANATASPDVADAPPAASGLSRAEVEEVVRAAIAAIPTKADPAEYTRHVVDSAVAFYESQGLDAAVARYNSAGSVDGQWYVFIVDDNGLVIAHPDAGRRGLDLRGWVGTDANGYEFGPQMLSATESGKWVSYVYRNPESGGIGSGSGDFELKNVWVTKHDGLLFASGWYIDADAFTQKLVAEAVQKYRELGLSGTMAYFASPQSALAGLEAAVAYYNTTDTADGHWFAFIANPDGTIVGHSDPDNIGGDVEDLLGGEAHHATENGQWIETETLRVWAASHDGHLFGAGWRRNQ